MFHCIIIAVVNVAIVVVIIVVVVIVVVVIVEAMYAPIPSELNRLLSKYGGVPVGSFFSGNILKPCTAHAMFIDATHDNDPGHIQVTVWEGHVGESGRGIF